MKSTPQGPRVLTLSHTVLMLFLIGSLSCASEEEAPDKAVSISFSVTVGDAPFVCGQTYEGLGSTGTPMGFVDMRFYIHDLALLDANGTEYPIAMDSDGIWQRDGVALLDFEDGCENGTLQVNTSVTGIVPNGNHVGIRFSVGVPPELNSSETVLEGRGSPLNQAAMFWSWKSGYKYVRLDGDTGPFRFHLGASSCSADFECDEMNIPTVTLDGFESSSHVVQLDVAELVKGTDISKNTPSTAPGCMGESSDPDCEDIFIRVGLGEGAAQTAWSVRDMPAEVTP